MIANLLAFDSTARGLVGTGNVLAAKRLTWAKVAPNFYFVAAAVLASDAHRLQCSY
jgi:hypothetical protein